MNTTEIYFKIETKSNLFIGGIPRTFEIGGVDQYTVEDFEGYPYIPASTMKGCLRAMIRDMKETKESKKIEEYYRRYFEINKEKNERLAVELLKKEEKITHYKKNYENTIKDVSAESLFGIEGFNHTPKLIFNDFMLSEEHKKKEKKDLFSIDAKNTIEIKDKPQARPRIYKTVRPGVSFEGSIYFDRIEQLNVNPNENVEEMIKEFLIHSMQKFNEGIYRIGNSKSRGYGRVQVTLIHEQGV